MGYNTGGHQNDLASFVPNKIDSLINVNILKKINDQSLIENNVIFFMKITILDFAQNILNKN